MGVVGYINEYSTVQHILPSLAPHLFPDSFNRRASPRVVLGIPIAYRFGNTIATALTLNISRGGIAIRTTSPLAGGAKIKIRFRLPRGKREVDVEARVAWTDRRVGMGLQFEGVTPPIRPPSTSSSRPTSSAIAGPDRGLPRPAAAPLQSRHGSAMPDMSHFVRRPARDLALVFANGFFVAAEFSLVTVRKTRIDQLVAEGSATARGPCGGAQRPGQLHRGDAARHHHGQPGPGWVGEPALAGLIEPMFPPAGPHCRWRPRIRSPSSSRSSSSPPCTSCSANWRRRPSRSSTRSHVALRGASRPSSSCACAGRSSAC